jgi:hypothetical protein
MKIKPINANKHLRISYIILYYKRGKLLICIGFGQSFGHPQGGVMQRIY